MEGKVEVKEQQRGKSCTEKRNGLVPGLSICWHSLPPGVLVPPPQPCSPPCPPSMHRHTHTPHTRTHVHTAGTAQGHSRESASAELILLLRCLEVIQGHPCCSQGKHQLLKPDSGFEELLLYFYTFISLHFQQPGTAHLQNHLGKQKDGNFHKKLFPGKRLDVTPCPCQARGH